MSVTCSDGMVVIFDEKGGHMAPIETVENCIRVYRGENCIPATDCPTCTRIAESAKSANEGIYQETLSGMRCPDCGRLWEAGDKCSRCGLMKGSLRYFELMEELKKEHDE